MKEMTYDVSYPEQFIVAVKVPDKGKHSWVWGEGPMFDWCRENCSDEWSGRRYRAYETEWLFKSEKDAIMFSLRWL